jgi:hypothetical protein
MEKQPSKLTIFLVAYWIKAASIKQFVFFANLWPEF